MLRERLIFAFLWLLRLFSRLFYRHDTAWVGEVDEQPWKEFRLIVVLNHTSLFEWLFAGSVPLHFLKRIAYKALVPVADKTLRRPLVGPFFRMLIPHCVEITRQADHTWQKMLDRLDPSLMVIIFPEGRMKRAGGLDSDGKPMTVRGGVADILLALPDGPMMIAYSGGLHHVQAPGQHLPRLFKKIRLRYEGLEVDDYRRSIGAVDRPAEFKRRVRADLERRRDLYCRPMEEAAGIRYPAPQAVE